MTSSLNPRGYLVTMSTAGSVCVAWFSGAPLVVSAVLSVAQTHHYDTKKFATPHQVNRLVEMYQRRPRLKQKHSLPFARSTSHSLYPCTVRHVRARSVETVSLICVPQVATNLNTLILS